MFQNFSEEARKTITMAKEEMLLLHHPYVLKVNGFYILRF